jgi:uncharacterized protein
MPDNGAGRGDSGEFQRVLIPLRDGIELSGNLWLPEADRRSPTIFVYTPYQKDSFAAPEHATWIGRFVASGYAVLIVDLRGVGPSEGITSGSLDPREGEDATEVIAWAAGQPWSDGAIGMFGSSYECMTAFAAGALRPPALKAIVGLEGFFDGYRDTAYPGGARNFLGMIGAWGGMMLALQLMPPTWQDPGGRWRRIWNQRLAEAEPFMLAWHQHQTRDEYWASRVLAIEKIEAPTFLIGGLRDLFPDAMTRAYERISAPKKLWLGPWQHAMPDTAAFEPADYLPEVLRWWDRWLRGQDNGIDQEPPVALYVQGAGWRAERDWPLARSTRERFHLTSAGLSNEVQGEADWLPYTADPTVGVAAGLWEPLATGLGLPLPQGEDECRSVTFTSGPVAKDLEITGSPVARLRIRVLDGADALVSVKLAAVDEAGQSALITSGILRASHREGSSDPVAIIAGQEIDLDIPLAATSYLVRRGYRLRLSCAGADFPKYWPLPENAKIEICAGGPGGSSLDVPIAPEGETLAGRFPDPIEPTTQPPPLVLQFRPTWKIERDLAATAVSVSTGSEFSALIPDGGTMAMKHVATASVARESPSGAHVVSATEIRLRTPLDQEVTIESSSDVGQHGVVLNGHVTLDGQEVFRRTWRA